MRLVAQQQHAVAARGAAARPSRGVGAAAAAARRARCAPRLGAVAGPECAGECSPCSGAPTGRRAALLGAAAALAAVPLPAAAAEDSAVRANREVATADSPYIQELLRRSEEKREERKAERLRDYYKRNFGDYMEFETSGAAARARGISEETAAAMRKWLADNAE